MMDPTSGNIATATHSAFTQLAEFAVRFAFSITGALVLLVGGWILSGIISRSAYRGLSRVRGIDETLARFFENVIHYLLLLLVILMVLGQFGVQTTSIVAALGAAGLAIGLALQGTLQNIAAGIMLLILRPMRLGEFIETSGLKGYVREIGLFATRLETPDGHYLMAPNSTLWNLPITNHSRSTRRRQVLAIGVGNEVDAAAVKSAILDILIADERVENQPAPQVYSDDLTADKTVLSIEYWAKTPVWTEARHDLIDQIKDGLKSQGVILK